MLFFLSIIAGGIGASAASGLFPGMALRGSANIAGGLVAGTLVWLVGQGLLGGAADELTTLLMTLAFSAAGGGAASLGLGYLARFFDDR